MGKKLTADQIEHVKQLSGEGAKAKEIATLLSLSRASVNRILRGDRDTQSKTALPQIIPPYFTHLDTFEIQYAMGIDAEIKISTMNKSVDIPGTYSGKMLIGYKDIPAYIELFQNLQKHLTE